MIDARIRRLIDPALNRAGIMLHQSGIAANQVTWAGFVVGLVAVPLLALEWYGAAICAIAINRIADGLDGAVARAAGPTDFGGYLDIVVDFIFYSAVVFGVTLAQPEQAVWGAFLIFSFVGTGSSFLAYAIFAEKHGITTEVRGAKSIYYLGGLTEGFETIVVLIMICLFPGWLWLISLVFGMMCWVTTTMRIVWAYRTLGER